MIKVLHELQEMFRVVGIPPVQKCQELLKQIMYVILAMFSFVLAFFSICIRFMLLFLSSLTDHVLLRCNTFQAVNKILNTSYTKCYWKKLKKKKHGERIWSMSPAYFSLLQYMNEVNNRNKQTKKRGQLNLPISVRSVCKRKATAFQTELLPPDLLSEKRKAYWIEYWPGNCTQA